MGLRFTGGNNAILATPVIMPAGSTYTVRAVFRPKEIPANTDYVFGDIASTDNYIRINTNGIIVIKVGGKSNFTGVVVSLVSDMVVEVNVDSTNIIFKVNGTITSTQAAPVLDFNCRYVASYNDTVGRFEGTIEQLQLGDTSWAFDSGNLDREQSNEFPTDPLKDLVYSNILKYNWYFGIFIPVLETNKFLTDIVMCGASNINSAYKDGLHLDAEARFRDAGYDIAVHNRAVAGDNAGELKARIRGFIDEFKDRASTTMFVVHIGGNNVTADGPYPGGAEELHDDLEAILFELKYEGFLVAPSFITYRIPPASNPTEPYNTNIILPLQAVYGDKFLDLHAITELNQLTWIAADGVHLSLPDGRTGVRNYITDEIISILLKSYRDSIRFNVSITTKKQSNVLIRRSLRKEVTL